ncbi:hypothetical protein M409DRAFT_61701 [Zasmidium cellare ATCC 36951]|uniref:6-phosphogluconate dehydrogenase NADP-binding domain-containing protein n=1 Tax=Zasmidium cellare ATCC 36951 TaxID=1080233 RepID=A0A6A6BWH5_ZASCE|nr:uncharacterized protein M409DRAFT_61701 [Zasmidium cellare ATCC 36951]KAF2158388.1 hypothetical protein M409DRAFT_61701 [Zasmidium cellare ATCC 36951]
MSRTITNDINGSHSLPRIAWIGLGNIGAGMCKNIAAKAQIKLPVSVFDVDMDRVRAVQSHDPKRFRIAASVVDAVRESDMIFYSVPDDAIVLDVVKQITSIGIEDKIMVDCSTIHPDTTTKEDAMIGSRSGKFVACPVFGAAAMADSGQLICNLAGQEESVAKVRPFCNGVTSAHTIDLAGQSPAQATLLKIIGNTFVLNMVSVLSEGHVLAETSGLGTDVLHQFIELMFPGPYTKYSERMLSGDYYKTERPLFSVALARKDARHAQALANSAGFTLENVATADNLLRVVEKHRGQQAEMAAMYGSKRLDAGLAFENQQQL